MIGIARETLVLRREGITPSLALLIPTFAFPFAPGWLTPAIQRKMECSPTDTFIIFYPASSVSALYPIIIHAQSLDQ
jgi:hypothetical protein